MIIRLDLYRNSPQKGGMEPQLRAIPQAGRLPERKRGSGVRYVYDTLRDEILDLTLLPGTPIDENQLAERLQMSRTPIREALVRLAGDGLVTTLPNRTTVVAQIDFLNLHQFFDALTLMYRVTTRLAGENRTDADLRSIRAHQAAFARAVEAQDAHAMIATNRDFHAAIGEAGRNAYYQGLFLRLLDEGRRILRIYYSSFDNRLPDPIVQEHEAMIAAIAARDIDACDTLAKAHADQIIGHIQAMLTRDRRQPIGL
jgi:DNA-binding GntR family transcriptional regulator